MSILFGELVDSIGGIENIPILLIRFFSIFIFSLGILVAFDVNKDSSLFIGGISMGYGLALFFQPISTLVLTLIYLIPLIQFKK